MGLFLRNLCVMCHATNEIKGLQHYTNITQRNVIMIIKIVINEIKGRKKVLVVFGIATNFVFVATIRTSIELR